MKCCSSEDYRGPSSWSGVEVPNQGPPSSLVIKAEPGMNIKKLGEVSSLESILFSVGKARDGEMEKISSEMQGLCVVWTLQFLASHAQLAGLLISRTSAW